MKLTWNRVLILSLLLVLVWIPAHTQQDNLLTNPGFEAPFEDKSVQGEPPRIVANGWEPWHVPPAAGSSSAENQQPEYFEVAPDTSRIRSGENAQGYFTFFATHTGGVYQRVTGITPGTELRFSVYAYVWSSSFEDVDFSEEPGDVVVFVGIDPTGGTDGTSSDIVWSPPAPDQYDAYREYSVIATASSNAVTVFVRSIVDFPIQNNFIYLDDAALTRTTTGTNPTPTPTEAADTPTPEEATPTPEEATPTPEGSTPTPEQATPTPIPTDTPTNTPDPGEDPTPTREGPGIVTPDPNTPPFMLSPTPTDTPTLPPTATPTDTPTSPPDVISPTTDSGQVFQNTIVHTVQRGDTVSRIATLYNSTTQAIIEANNLNEDALIFVGQGLVVPVRQPAPATVTPSPTPVVIVVTATPGDPGIGGGIPAGTVYVVQPGDTLNRIAARFNTTVAQLAQLNGIANPNRIQAGQRLLISEAATGGPNQPGNIVTPSPDVAPPQPFTYVVQPGDNLYRISLRFGTTMRALVDANNIANVNRIFAGQTLIIP